MSVDNEYCSIILIALLVYCYLELGLQFLDYNISP